MAKIVRFGVSIEEDLLENFDKIIEDKGYNSRSEAIRDLIRDYIIKEKWNLKKEKVAGSISLIYEHDVYGLSEKLTDIQHHYHDVIISTLHVHLDEKNCMEVILVRGKVEKIKRLYDELSSLKWVRHTNIAITDII
ncbi:MULTISPECIES: nickel-responsive transcriptional regulator NikR [Dictyoglomus]|jgi:CopG family nickel-responsive transcriptional regulator|uniref:Putative nickel-responsive regulator n=1 Tax=Dictyoglomus turgidum (strain DSM 6724 / Z-1310) TaxID=515635 RepID=NIKR_DICTD|nr:MULTISPECIES: nickel-responsive transcriptional regulator NikR [Dictyoglomus]B8E0M0.1 RecName: Full=Putative nickel-responsive regulator [Dictyoglomus turgidum DSM 6724]ACK43040.1 putative transcriptional regulator, CopG family [Dictyoglomus turgidum DSM 6724]PNV79475.1 MAG: nickel-responsive transcriptional regulator NikR [Dictyoglomus turgidum]HBU31101.1 nickel-responsive transcriptional regulator NikR [Dictyoglomus sp.]